MSRRPVLPTRWIAESFEIQEPPLPEENDVADDDDDEDDEEDDEDDEDEEEEVEE